MIVFSVYDKKAEYFLQPMFARNAAQMIRDLEDVVLNPDSLLSKHPADYTLYQLASFDDVTGVFSDVERIKLGDLSSIYSLNTDDLFAGKKE